MKRYAKIYVSPYMVFNKILFARLTALYVINFYYDNIIFRASCINANELICRKT